MLLPWYATGRLGRADMARVESYLARHPQLARQLDLVRDEQAVTVAANEALGWPSAGAVDRLMARLPAAPRGGSPWRVGAQFFQGLREFFAAPTAAGVRWVAAGVAALLAVQAATIATLLLSDRGGHLPVGVGSQERRRRRLGSRRLHGRGDGACHFPAAGGIRRQHRRRTQARRAIQDQVADGGPVAGGGPTAAAGGAARYCPRRAAKQGLIFPWARDAHRKVRPILRRGIGVPAAPAGPGSGSLLVSCCSPC